MLGDPNPRPVLEALRRHVLLDPGVSGALTALHERERDALTVVVREACDLAGRLDPTRDGRHQSQDALESWLGAVLRGPHDGSWFDLRIRSPLRGWSDPPTLASVLVIASVRQRVTEIAAATSPKPDHTTGRIAEALARLFDLEVALAHFHLDMTGDGRTTVAEVDPVRALVGEAGRNIRSALGVIETSAYLVRRYTQQVAIGHPRVELHLGRIVKHVQQTQQEISRLVEATRPRRGPMN